MGFWQVLTTTGPNADPNSDAMEESVVESVEAAVTQMVGDVGKMRIEGFEVKKIIKFTKTTWWNMMIFIEYMCVYIYICA